MTVKDDCIFCKIANHEIESNYVYEDDLVCAFRDMSPLAPTHVLIVPKQHYDSIMDDVPAEVLAAIAASSPDDILFYGNSKSVVAVRIGDAELFREHFDRVRTLFIDGEIEKCKGWQVYQSVTGQDLTQKPVIGDKFVLVDERTTDINTPEEYRNI